MRLTRFSCALVMRSLRSSRMDHTSDEEEWEDFRRQLPGRLRWRVPSFRAPRSWRSPRGGRLNASLIALQIDFASGCCDAQVVAAVGQNRPKHKVLSPTRFR